MISGVKGFSLCANLIALEGWRRGLTLRWYYNGSDVTNLKPVGYDPVGKTFSLSSGEKTHFFYRSRGDKVDNTAVDIGASKEETKKYLSEYGVSNPEGFSFTKSDDIESVIDTAKKMGFPLVLKPTFGSLGKGVITNINTEAQLRKNLSHVFSEFDYTNFIIERYIEGDDLRVYVVDDKAIGAIKRITAHVIGNGIHSIEELINFKNEDRKKNPYLAAKLIKMDNQVIEYLSEQNLLLSSVPKKDEVIFLKAKSNITSGGDSIDITDELTNEVKTAAVNAVKAIPGLYHAGVDIIANKNDAVVIEINPTAGIAMHHFPVQGKPRNIPAGVIDYYFPETIGKAAKSTKIYFDYSNILKLLRSRSVNQLEIPNAPIGELYAKRYVISGKVQGVGYRNWVRKQALINHLNGYTRNLKNGKVVVVVAGVNKELVDNFKEICLSGPKKAEVKDVQEYVWDKQIKIGFEIRKDR